MKTVLITGNSGYIGSHLSKNLEGKYRLIGLDLVNPKAIVTDHIIADIRNLDQISYNIDTVIHLAAKVKVNESIVDPINYYSTNLVGTINLLHKVKFKNFIFASTGSANYCNNPYGISKRAAEDCVEQFCHQHKKSWTIFRFYNVIGSNGFAPTNPDGLFFNLIQAIDNKKFTIFGHDYKTKDGTAERDYVHVDEICRAIEMAIEQPANNLENLGHGKGYTVQEIVDTFKKVNNVNFNILLGPRRSGDLESSVLDNPSKYLPNLYNIDDLLQLR